VCSFKHDYCRILACIFLTTRISARRLSDASKRSVGRFFSPNNIITRVVCANRSRNRSRPRLRRRLFFFVQNTHRYRTRIARRTVIRERHRVNIFTKYKTKICYNIRRGVDERAAAGDVSKLHRPLILIARDEITPSNTEVCGSLCGHLSPNFRRA